MQNMYEELVTKAELLSEVWAGRDIVCGVVCAFSSLAFLLHAPPLKSLPSM